MDLCAFGKFFQALVTLARELRERAGLPIIHLDRLQRVRLHHTFIATRDKSARERLLCAVRWTLPAALGFRPVSVSGLLVNIRDRRMQPRQVRLGCRRTAIKEERALELMS